MLHLLLAALLAAPQEHTKEIALVRDQPHLGRLARWNGQWIVRSDRVYVIGLADGSLQPLECSDVDRVLEVAESSKRRLLFGVRGDVPKLLRIESDGQAAEISLPELVKAHPEDWRIAASDARAVLLNGSTLYVCTARDFTRSEVNLGHSLWNPRNPETPRAIVIHEDQVFVSVAAGEWGGGLWSIDLKHGDLQLVEKDSDPATGLAADDDGRLWATWGQSHIGAGRGTLRVLEHGNWKLIAHSDGFEATHQKNWKLAPSSFEGVVHEGKRVFLVTSTLGVVELIDGAWHRCTPDWPDHAYATGLGIEGDRAIIPMYDAGIVSWNMRTGDKRMVRTAPAQKR